MIRLTSSDLIHCVFCYLLLQHRKVCCSVARLDSIEVNQADFKRNYPTSVAPGIEPHQRLAQSLETHNKYLLQTDLTKADC